MHQPPSTWKITFKPNTTDEEKKRWDESSAGTTIENRFMEVTTDDRTRISHTIAHSRMGTKLGELERMEELQLLMWNFCSLSCTLEPQFLLHGSGSYQGQNMTASSKSNVPIGFNNTADMGAYISQVYFITDFLSAPDVQSVKVLKLPAWYSPATTAAVQLVFSPYINAILLSQPYSTL